MKKIFKDEHEKRAALLTMLTVFIVFLWLFFHTAFEYQDPPEEYGMEVNFGTTDFGSGDNQTQEPLKMQPEETETPQEPVEEPVEEPVDEQPVEETSEAQPEEVTEEVITEDTTEDVPVVNSVEDVKEEQVEPVKEESKPDPVKNTPNEEPKKEAPKEDPKPDQATEDALSNVLNGPPADGPSTDSEGDDSEDGDKGKINGDPNAPDYYTNPGNGSGGNYQLIGRLALRRPSPLYTCKAEGTVVVSIKVSRSGKVIEATPGVKGSTTSDTCLLNRAKEAALKTKWQSAENAPEKQVGKIIYNFSLR